MFTGIIRATGKIKKVIPQKDGGLSMSISKPRWNIKKGDSITVNGVCSTVKKTAPALAFEYMPETLSKTNLSALTEKNTVNLEQSLRASDRLDGHMVLGHIDTTGKILSIKTEGNSKVFKINIKDKDIFMKFLVPKGSVAVEGISLTVVDVSSNYFTVKILPYTLEETNLKERKEGDVVNIEFDILAKYLLKQK